jgi:NAD-dependent DNA ligase
MNKLVKTINDDPFNEIDKLSVVDLEKVITHTADKYYNTDTSIVTDSVYDLMIDFLKKKDPKSKVLKTVGARLKSKAIKLPYWMGSMDKIKPPSNELNKWLSKYNQPYYLSDKLDGVSALLVYSKDDIKLYSRGTANEGHDISKLLKYIKHPTHTFIKNYLNELDIKGINNIIAVRGELVIKQKVFKDKWSDKLKNPRNTVAGVVNSKHIDPHLASDIDLVLYEIVDPFVKISKQYKLLHKLGFNYVHNTKVIVLSYEILNQYLKIRKKDSEYEIDGIIVTNNDQHSRNITGNPDYAFAFKDILDDQIAQAKIVDVIWNTSKDGYLNPVVVIEKTSLGGVDISRLSAYNAKFIVDNNIGIGATIQFIRSGDVIPKILKVLKPASKPKMPDVKYEWNKTKVDIKLVDMYNNNDIATRNIMFFFKKLDIKFVGEGVATKLVNNGYNTIYKVLNASKDDLLKIPTFKEKTVSNILNEIKDKLSSISLAKLMAASNMFGHGFGETRAKAILNTYPNILTMKKTSNEWIDDISELDGFNTITATIFADGLTKFIKFYESIKDKVQFAKVKTTTSKLSNKSFVFSGFRDANLQKNIEENGGTIKNSIGKDLTYLVVKDKSSLNEKTSKITKANELKINIITKDNLIKILT